MTLDTVRRHRTPLSRTRLALGRGELRLGFIGGSINAPYLNTWPEGVISWFTEKFPRVRLHIENAAIGATGTMLGVFRARPPAMLSRVKMVPHSSDLGKPPAGQTPHRHRGHPRRPRGMHRHQLPARADRRRALNAKYA
jgi:hypothetical protein